MLERKLKSVVYICAAFFAVALVYFFIGNKETKIVTETSIPVATSTNVAPIVRMEAFTYATSSINLSVEYPQFVGSATGTVGSVLNTQLKKEAQALYNIQLEELSQSVTPDSVGVSGNEVFFQRKLLKEKIYINTETGIVSIPYSNYVDTGGAHGTFFYTSETVDSVTGTSLVLKDFLQDEYERVISGEVKRQVLLGTSTETCVNCFEGLSEQEDIPVFVSEHFLLTEKGIVFLYGAYDLGPYALTSAGQEIFVSKETLERFINRVW